MNDFDVGVQYTKRYMVLPKDHLAVLMFNIKYPDIAIKQIEGLEGEAILPKEKGIECLNELKGIHYEPCKVKNKRRRRRRSDISEVQLKGIIIPNAMVGLEPLLNENENEKECVICLERSAKTAIVDCGHQCLCVTCARSLKDTTCPMCRIVITHIIRLY